MLIKIIKSRLFIFVITVLIFSGFYVVNAVTTGTAPGLSPSQPWDTGADPVNTGVDSGDLLTSGLWNALVNKIESGAFNNIINETNILQSCSICVSYADKNGDRPSPQNFICAQTGLHVDTNFVGNVDANDDLDIMITCTDPAVNSAFQLCKRYADLNLRYEKSWQCVDFGTSLNHDFVGNVNDDDNFDLLIKHKNPTSAVYLTNCGIGVRYSDREGNACCGRAVSEFRFAKIGKVLQTDFSGNVDSNDIFDLKLSCNIDFEE